MPEIPQESHRDDDSAVPIIRHKAPERDYQVVAEEGEGMEILEAHINKYFGPVENVFHELISELVHIDVHIIPAGSGRNYHTLVTTGMSDRPMKAPPGAEGFEYAELLIQLPPDWPLDENSFRDEQNYWPVLWLKRLARFPHEYDTWLFHGHTVPNGDPVVGFDPTTKLCCWLLIPPNIPDEDGGTAQAGPDKKVYFFQLVPLYAEEMELRLRRGNDALLQALDKSGLSLEQFFIIDRTRPNAIQPKRGFWPFRR